MAEKDVLRHQLAITLDIIASLEARGSLDELETYVLIDQQQHKDLLVARINAVNDALADDGDQAEDAADEPETP